MALNLELPDTFYLWILSKQISSMLYFFVFLFPVTPCLLMVWSYRKNIYSEHSVFIELFWCINTEVVAAFLEKQRQKLL